MSNRRRRRKRNPWKWVLIVLGFILIIAGIGIYFTYSTLRNTAEEVYRPTTENVDNKTNEEAEEKIRKTESVSILLLGSDSGGGRTTGEMNTDVMMLVTINPDTETANMISIPRDTYSEYTGGKINAAYAMGGAEGSMEAVEALLDVPVDNYALVNMTGIMNIIDAIGGVTVYNDNAFSQANYSFPVGEVTLVDGEHALAYMRNRYSDPDGDYGRNERQREVLLAILDKFSGVSVLTNVGPLLDTVTANVVTDLTWDNMVKLAMNYRVSSENVNTQTLVGTPENSPTAGYLNVLSEQQKAEISQQIKKDME